MSDFDFSQLSFDNSTIGDHFGQFDLDGIHLDEDSSSLDGIITEPADSPFHSESSPLSESSPPSDVPTTPSESIFSLDGDLSSFNSLTSDLSSMDCQTVLDTINFSSLPPFNATFHQSSQQIDIAMDSHHRAQADPCAGDESSLDQILATFDELKFFSLYPTLPIDPEQARLQQVCHGSSAAPMHAPMEMDHPAASGPSDMDPMAQFLWEPAGQPVGQPTVSAPRASRVRRKAPAGRVENKRRFECPKCHFAFVRRHNLETHILTHDASLSKRFKCPREGCRKFFTRKHDLERHLLSKFHRFMVAKL
ncbi:hypothetical protein A0H81_12145 [Grifola frondosa]|uniref:C2H2-type domain-containing protein n=1 Tax=Grifola frondosa TaxID=5627 RepID=A0A1C7LT51_GRIFR|nr:hypothetical protein A0H81_12145 [Grifola frondosa]